MIKTFRVFVPAAVSGGRIDRETRRPIERTQDGVEFVSYYQRNLRVVVSKTWAGRPEEYTAVEVLP